MTTTTSPHQTAGVPIRTAPVAGRDGTDGRTDGDLSKDTLLRTLFTELAGKIKAGEYVSATRRNVSQGQIYIFRVQPAGALTPDERFRICLDWMKRNQITNRRAFFAGCPEASKNAALHHRCINALKRAGLIERVGREYVFKEE